MSLSTEQAAFLLDACKLIQYATDQGFVVTGGELARTPEQQAIYFKTGRSKTMNSIHLKRCAIDLNFFKDGKIIWDKAVLAPLGGVLGVAVSKESLGWELLQSSRLSSL
jgi:hypothetical protein